VERSGEILRVVTDNQRSSARELAQLNEKNRRIREQ
jgi:hypothetical protein